MKVFICPTGTSILTVKGIGFSDIEHRPGSEYAKYEKTRKLLKHQLESHKAHQNAQKNLDEVSAEFKSLVKMGADKSDIVYLLHSDTVDGRFSAEINRDLLEDYIACHTELKIIPDLQAVDETRFRKNGLKNFVDNIFQLINKHQGNQIILNATAGYKVLVPYLTILGMVHNLPVKYIFEKSDTVFTLSGIPLDLDYDLLLPVFPKLRRIETETAIGLADWQSDIDYTDTRYDWLIEIEAGQVTMSSLGLMFYEKLKVDWGEEFELCPKKPEEKKIHLKKGDEDPPVVKLANRLVKSPYVCEILNTLPFNPKQQDPILECRDDGILHLVLTYTAEGLGLAVQTTGRNATETQKIGRRLVKKFFQRI